mmetsp:Transcript_22063/g.74503  ORF Transcript_22063/g.74503 Transcript_22063/m.74503 type:complete len:447 (+) Transcript_22063:54-1394(+)
MSDSLCLHLRLEIPEFTKVGLRVDRKNRVISVASGSPAALAGLMPNDLIEQVEGLSLTAERGVQAALADRTTSAPLLRVRRGGGGRRAKPSKSDGQPASEVEACEEGNGEGGFETLLLSLSLKAGERAGMRVDANEVLTVAPDTPAAMAGLRAGDVVAEVDGVAVGEGGATTLLHALSDRSRPSRSLTVVRRRAASKSASPATEAKAEGAEEAEGELEEELLCVELSRDGAGSLGIKALQGGQIVSVMPGGAAASAGLAAGDDILEVDGEEVVGSSSGIFSLLPPTKADFSLLVRRRAATGGGAAGGRTDGSSVQRFLGEYMSDVSASLSRSQDESALASHEESGRARAAAAAAAALLRPLLRCRSASLRRRRRRRPLRRRRSAPPSAPPPRPSSLAARLPTPTMAEVGMTSPTSGGRRRAECRTSAPPPPHTPTTPSRCSQAAAG